MVILFPGVYTNSQHSVTKGQEGGHHTLGPLLKEVIKTRIKMKKQSKEATSHATALPDEQMLILIHIPYFYDTYLFYTGIKMWR
jgi:hypothetical protein